jgi:hypothetical protein
MAFTLILPIRIAQAVLAVIILALLAYGMYIGLLTSSVPGNKLMSAYSGERLVVVVVVSFSSQFPHLYIRLDSPCSRVPGDNTKPLSGLGA